MSQNQGLFRQNQLKRAHSGRKAEAAAREMYREQEKLKSEAKPKPAPVPYNEHSRRVSELLFRNAELRIQVDQLQEEIVAWSKRVDVLEQIIAESYAHSHGPVEVITIKKGAPNVG